MKSGLFDKFEYGKVNKSVISRELAEKLLDLDADGWCPVSAYKFRDKVGAKSERVVGPNYKAIEVGEIKGRHYKKDLFALVDGLPKGWSGDVYYISIERAGAKREAEKAAAVAAYDGPAVIKQKLEKLLASQPRGFEPPKVVDLSMLKPRADRKYKPASGCSAKLKLKQAVCYAHSQESYADYSYYLVPVEGVIGDVEVCKSNLRQWCYAIASHNGFAGSGSNWEAGLVVREDGAYVELSQRASISD